MSDAHLNDDGLQQFRPPTDDDYADAMALPLPKPTLVAPPLAPPAAFTLPVQPDTAPQLAAVEVETADTQTASDESKSTTRRAKPDVAAVRKVAAKYDELAHADATHIELLSTVLGVSSKTVDLTVAVITGSRSKLAALTDILALNKISDPYEGLVATISLGRPRLKAAWAVLTTIGAVTGPIPGADVKAGASIAKAANELDPLNIDEINAVLTLAKR